MKPWRHQHPVNVMARVFAVSRRGCYQWLQGIPSARARQDERLRVAIRAAHTPSRETYGVRRLQPELASEGFVAGRDRIARLHRELGLRYRQKRKFQATTNANHSLPVAENRLDQQFSPTAPHQVWVTDITDILTDEGWLYLAGLKEVFTGAIVGYALGERMTQELTARAVPGHTAEASAPGPDSPLGSRQPVRCPRLPRPGRVVRPQGLDVPPRQLLRQRPHGELLGQPEKRAGAPPPFRHPRRGGVSHS